MIIIILIIHDNDNDDNNTNSHTITITITIVILIIMMMMMMMIIMITTIDNISQQTRSFNHKRQATQQSNTPGGSSGGAAAALASCQCWLASGSDLGGLSSSAAWFMDFLFSFIKVIVIFMFYHHDVSFCMVVISLQAALCGRPRPSAASWASDRPPGASSATAARRRGRCEAIVLWYTML